MSVSTIARFVVESDFFIQMSMNVSVVHTTAVVMQHVLTVMAVTHVHVYLAMKEMDTPAPVGFVHYSTVAYLQCIA